MYKKAGLVVSVLIFALAIILLLIFKESDEKPSDSLSNNGVNTEVGDTETQPPIDEQTPQNNTNVENGDQSVSSEQVVIEKEVLVTDKVFQYLDLSDVEIPEGFVEELGTVLKKKIMLIDNAYGTNSKKQINYTLEVELTRGVIDVFINGSVLDSITVGEKLNILYRIVKNDNGVEFPLVYDVRKVQ